MGNQLSEMLYYQRSKFSIEGRFYFLSLTLYSFLFEIPWKEQVAWHYLCSSSFFCNLLINGLALSMLSYSGSL